jgi:hypothetical protein
MAGSMSIVQDDPHHDMGPRLQCVVLDEGTTAQLHDGQPTLSAGACHDEQCVQASAARDKRARTAAAASAANRARLVHGDGGDVQVHLPHAGVACLEGSMRREGGKQGLWARQRQRLAASGSVWQSLAEPDSCASKCALPWRPLRPERLRGLVRAHGGWCRPRYLYRGARSTPWTLVVFVRQQGCP